MNWITVQRGSESQRTSECSDQFGKQAFAFQEKQRMLDILSTKTQICQFKKNRHHLLASNAAHASVESLTATRAIWCFSPRGVQKAGLIIMGAAGGEINRWRNNESDWNGHLCNSLSVQTVQTRLQIMQSPPSKFPSEVKILMSEFSHSWKANKISVWVQHL